MGTTMGHERSRKGVLKSAARFFTQADSTWHQIFEARFFFFGMQLLYNVVLASTAQWSIVCSFFLFWSSLNYSDRCLRAVILHLVIQHLDDKIHTPLSTDLSKHQSGLLAFTWRKVWLLFKRQPRPSGERGASPLPLTSCNLSLEPKQSHMCEALESETRGSPNKDFQERQRGTRRRTEDSE